MSIDWVMPSNHLILCHLLLLSSIFPSLRVFSNESALLIRWPKYRCFSFSVGPSSEYLGLISFRIDWFDLLAVQGARKSLLQHHNWKASVLLRSAFFMSSSYITWFLEGINSTHTLILDFSASRTLKKRHFCCLSQPVVFCYGSPSRLIQMMEKKKWWTRGKK